MENNPIGNSKEKIELGLDEMEKFLKKYELEKIHQGFFEKIAILIIASFGLIAALAWDQALKLIFTDIFNGLETVGQKLLYATIITIIATILSIILSKMFLNRQKTSDKTIIDHLRQFIPKKK